MLSCLCVCYLFVLEGRGHEFCLRFVDLLASLSGILIMCILDHSISSSIFNSFIFY